MKLMLTLKSLQLFYIKTTKKSLDPLKETILDTRSEITSDFKNFRLEKNFILSVKIFLGDQKALTRLRSLKKNFILVLLRFLIPQILLG
jgi:hypothetical protein